MLLSLAKHWFHRPAIKMGRVDNSCIQTTRLRNAQFVSFIAQSGSLGGWQNSDRHESRMRRRKQLKTLFALMLAAGGAWVVIESARALTLF